VSLESLSVALWHRNRKAVTHNQRGKEGFPWSQYDYFGAEVTMLSSFSELNEKIDYSSNPLLNRMVMVSSICFRCSDPCRSLLLKVVISFTSIMLPTMSTSHAKTAIFLHTPSSPKHTVPALDILLPLIPY